MGYEKKNIYMRIKDAILKEHEPKKYRKRERENNGYLDARQKERKQCVLRHPLVRIKIAHTLKDFKKREV
jgi:hypothetical protein